MLIITTIDGLTTVKRHGRNDVWIFDRPEEAKLFIRSYYSYVPCKVSLCETTGRQFYDYTEQA